MLTETCPFQNLHTPTLQPGEASVVCVPERPPRGLRIEPRCLGLAFQRGFPPSGDMVASLFPPGDTADQLPQGHGTRERMLPPFGFSVSAKGTASKGPHQSPPSPCPPHPAWTPKP